MKSLTERGVKWFLQDNVASTDSSGEVISLEDLKQHSDVACAMDDDVLLSYLKAAQRLCAGLCPGGRQFVNRTFNIVMDGFPGSDYPVPLPLPPLSSIVNIGYYDSSGSTQTMASTDYLTYKPTNAQGYIKPRVSGTWPATQVRDDAVTIQFIAGYGTSTNVPHTIKQAVRLVAAHYFENPEAAISGVSREIDFGARVLMSNESWGYYG